MKVSNLRRLIREVLEPFELWSQDAEELLVLTAAAESLGGVYLYQDKGPAKGFWQMEPATEKDIIENFIKKKPEYVVMYNGIKAEGIDNLAHNLAYQVFMARLHYRRIKTSLPSSSSPTELAMYWKSHYNTRLGKGTVEGALKKYNDYLAGRYNG